MESPPKQNPRLVIREAGSQDIDGILELTKSVYTDMPPYSTDMIRGQVTHFPAGQFVAVYDGVIVGYAASFQVAEKLALEPHTWKEITGGGFGARSDPEGDWLYGMEVCVAPTVRGIRIGRRLYQRRKALCRALGLKGIVIAGRLPGLKKRWKDFSSPEAYVDAVKNRKIRDLVLSFQLRNGFEFVRVLNDYLSIDLESMGKAALLVWRNPRADQSKIVKSAKRPLYQKEKVRICTVQYKQRYCESFDEFAKIVEYYVDVAAEYSSDFVVFPEWFTLQLLSTDKEKREPAQAIALLADYTSRFEDSLKNMAIRHNVNIIGGSTAVRAKSGGIENHSFIFLRDGRVYTQAKLHPTPNERRWWNIKGGSQLQSIETDCGPIGVLICYDSEFPEAVRHLVNQGIRILFVPFCTDDRQAYLRVRYCCQARAVENQIYVALSGNVGNLPYVENMDVQYAQSCILTPCDHVFARDGVAADTHPNVEMVAVADVRLDDLIEARNAGTVQNLKDRRHDLYTVQWSGARGV
jgi:predicted amidohydrolase/GNAT superfamily N-acetyltransferase